jgi:hypothetical protein
MHPEIEKLIDLALADGQVTEKERNVILKKAAEFGVDADEVEMILDGKLHQLEASKPKQKVKAGNIITCPACGATVDSFTSKCIDCGHEYRNTNAVSSAQKLSILLNEASDNIRKAKEELQLSGVNKYNSHLFNPLNIAKEIHTVQATIISSFPVPNTKEDLLEFISLTDAEAKKKTNKISGYIFDGSDMIINAWLSKREQIINKSRIIFKDDIHLLKIIENYEANFKENSRVNMIRNMFSIPKPLLFFIAFFLIIFLFLIIGFNIGSFNTSTGREAEQERLEKIENQISNDMATHQYDQALLLTNQLHWQHLSTWDREDQKYIDDWDKRREDLKAIIEKMKIQNK